MVVYVLMQFNTTGKRQSSANQNGKVQPILSGRQGFKMRQMSDFVHDMNLDTEVQNNP